MNISLIRFGVTLACVIGALNAEAAPARPQPTRPVAAPTGRPEPVLIAFVYRDGVTESAWTQSHELARKAVDAEFGARVHTIRVERVATAAESDRVFRDLAARGYKVIFATDPIHRVAAAKMATADYDIKIEQVMGAQELINMRVYSIRHFEQAYLAGIIAAGNSRTLKLGFVAAALTPGTLAEINAFALGAQSVNKRATTQVLLVGSRTNPNPNPDAEAKAAETLIKRGVDVLLATTDSNAVTRVAERRRKRVIGWHADQSALAPRAHAASLLLDWGPFYKTAVNESFDYLCTKTDTSRGYREGAIKVVGLSSATSHTARARLQKVQSALVRGEFQVFTGPIKSSANAVVLADSMIGDEPWRKSMSFLLRGVTVVASP